MVRASRRRACPLMPSGVAEKSISRFDVEREPFLDRERSQQAPAADRRGRDEDLLELAGRRRRELAAFVEPVEDRRGLVANLRDRPRPTPCARPGSCRSGRGGRPAVRGGRAWRRVPGRLRTGSLRFRSARTRAGIAERSPSVPRAVIAASRTSCAGSSSRAWSGWSTPSSCPILPRAAAALARTAAAGLDNDRSSVATAGFALKLPSAAMTRGCRVAFKAPFLQQLDQGPGRDVGPDRLDAHQRRLADRLGRFRGADRRDQGGQGEPVVEPAEGLRQGAPDVGIGLLGEPLPQRRERLAIAGLDERGDRRRPDRGQRVGQEVADRS